MTHQSNARQHTQGFVPASQYVRSLPLRTTFVDLCVHHAERDSKRPVRAIADMLGATFTPKNRLNPLVKHRQTISVGVVQ